MSHAWGVNLKGFVPATAGVGSRVSFYPLISYSSLTQNK
jgi:hypothetical protein